MEIAIPKAEESEGKNFNQYTSDAGAKYQLPTFMMKKTDYTSQYTRDECVMADLRGAKQQLQTKT